VSVVRVFLLVLLVGWVVSDARAEKTLNLAAQALAQQGRILRCTRIISAHRLSTIRNADLILVLDQGTIVERGTHDQLLRQNGAAANLIHSQLASGEIQAGERGHPQRC
jgi:ABC-type multidrug transport system fused ATPase/permease subunit